MTIAFVGYSHAPRTLAAAALMKGFDVSPDIRDADLIFVSQDAPTDAEGKRDLAEIRQMVIDTVKNAPEGAAIVLTSQVEPGFTRSLNLPILCMAETLRIKDALERALAPEQFIIGKRSMDDPLPEPLLDYVDAHKGAALNEMLYEEAELAKIAINMFLAAQVEATNHLAAAAAHVGASWAPIANVLKCDKRIGKHAYVEPGRWQDSKHLLRDHYTLERILAR